MSGARFLARFLDSTVRARFLRVAELRRVSRLGNPGIWNWQSPLAVPVTRRSDNPPSSIPSSRTLASLSHPGVPSWRCGSLPTRGSAGTSYIAGSNPSLMSAAVSAYYQQARGGKPYAQYRHQIASDRRSFQHDGCDAPMARRSSMPPSPIYLRSLLGLVCHSLGF